MKKIITLSTSVSFEDEDEIVRELLDRVIGLAEGVLGVKKFHVSWTRCETGDPVEVEIMVPIDGADESMVREKLELLDRENIKGESSEISVEDLPESALCCPECYQRSIVREHGVFIEKGACDGDTYDDEGDVDGYVCMATNENGDVCGKVFFFRADAGPPPANDKYWRVPDKIADIKLLKQPITVITQRIFLEIELNSAGAVLNMAEAGLAEAARNTGGRDKPFGNARRPGRGHDDAAVGRDHVAVETDSAHPRRLPL